MNFSLLLSSFTLFHSHFINNSIFGHQELLIQQLQDQITDLRQRHLPDSGDASADPSELKQKLRQAALFIQQLAREKQQLIEVGNRLRAELVKAGEWAYHEKNTMYDKEKKN